MWLVGPSGAIGGGGTDIVGEGGHSGGDGRRGDTAELRMRVGHCLRSDGEDN